MYPSDFKARSEGYTRIQTHDLRRFSVAMHTHRGFGLIHPSKANGIKILIIVPSLLALQS